MTKPSQKPKRLRAVELFCGIGGFRIACDAEGFETAWANDISEESCRVYATAFGRASVHCGDIKEHKHSIPAHDLLTAGFPCQPFSSAGKKLGVRDARGTLFAEIVSVVTTHTPRHFILENVKRLLSMGNGEHFGTILHAFCEIGYSIEWRLLNAADFDLAQNRERLVIVGTRDAAAVPPPIKLATEADLAAAHKGDCGGLFDLPRWKPISTHTRRFPNWGIALNGRFYGRDLTLFSEARPRCTLRSVLQPDVSEEFYMDDSTRERIEQSIFVNRYVGGVQILFNQAGGARMGYTVFGVDGLAPTLTASHSRHYERYSISNRFRRLTNVEYARLQGFPDQHCGGVSVFNQYGLFGNAVPPPLARWAIARVFKESAAVKFDSLRTALDSGQIALAI